MKIAIFSVVLNIHQVNIADELYELTGHSFVFVELEKPVGHNNKGGTDDYSSKPYLLQAWMNSKCEAKAMEIARNAEIAIIGGYMALRYQIERLKEDRLTFEMGERWFKHWHNFFSPRLLKNIWNYHIRGWRRRPFYKLCSSAFAVNDQYDLKTFRGRCYKWGYFTKVEDLNIEEVIYNRHKCNIISGDSASETVTIMWCARFLKWKHPELVVKLAHRLKNNGYNVQIDMYGTGVEQQSAKALCQKLDVQDTICFKGNVSNDDILQAMREHDIFLFTSDRNEGWGAVLNEAMSNGCTVVASDAIGSVPYLVEDQNNGLVFKSEDLDSLYENVSYLIDNPSRRKEMAIEAYKTIKDIWSPHNAALNFIQLSKDLINGHDTSIEIGPCSKAYPITL